MKRRTLYIEDFDEKALREHISNFHPELRYETLSQEDIDEIIHTILAYVPYLSSVREILFCYIRLYKLMYPKLIFNRRCKDDFECTLVAYDKESSDVILSVPFDTYYKGDMRDKLEYIDNVLMEYKQKQSGVLIDKSDEWESTTESNNNIYLINPDKITTLKIKDSITVNGKEYSGIVEPIGVRIDKNSYPHFLLCLDGNWVWLSAKHFNTI